MLSDYTEQWGEEASLRKLTWTNKHTSAHALHCDLLFPSSLSIDEFRIHFYEISPSKDIHTCFIFLLGNMWVLVAQFLNSGREVTWFSKTFVEQNSWYVIDVYKICRRETRSLPGQQSFTLYRIYWTEHPRWWRHENENDNENDDGTRIWMTDEDDALSWDKVMLVNGSHSENNGTFQSVW